MWFKKNQMNPAKILFQVRESTRDSVFQKKNTWLELELKDGVVQTPVATQHLFSFLSLVKET